MTDLLSRGRAPAPDGPPSGAPARPVRRRSRWRVALGALVVLAVIAGVGWVVLVSSVLGARTVDVRGEHLLTAQQVRAAAAIRDGAPLARLDTGAVRRRVEALPEVAAAKVDVSYPSTVTIDVTERVAVAVQKNASGAPVLVDATGKAFRQVDAPPAGLPEITAAQPDTLTACAQVAEALPAALRASIATIGAQTVNSITLTLADGRTVLWGSSADNAKKAALLPTLLSQPGDSFDISADGIVVVR
jgi:cell division protein FtsQ